MPKRSDNNQAEIVEALRAVGATIEDLHTLGEYAPDLLVGFRGFNYLFYVGGPGPWHTWWRGRKPIVVYTVDQALVAIGVELTELRLVKAKGVL